VRDAVVVDAVRTPVGRRRGMLSGVHPVDLSAVVLAALARRTGLDPADVDDVVWGCVSQVGEQTSDIARGAVLAAGWPEHVPGTTVDRQCGSSQQALAFAAAAVASGQQDLVVAGGVESMSRVPLGSAASVAGEPFGPTVLARYADRLAAAGLTTFDQGVGAELLARRHGLSREELDRYALQSHERAAAAADAGQFEAEIEPVTLADGTVVTADEGIRRDTDLQRLAGLAPVFVADGLVTAGSSSQISDGAAALLVTTSEQAARRGWRPLARVHTTVVLGADPVEMLGAPGPATRRLLERSGVPLAAIGSHEVNEAFAPVPLAWLAETGADPATVNPQGGAIALGHPLGASGARLTATLLHRMRRTGDRYGLQTMCEGGGMANATLFEAWEPQGERRG
jgi:acetyl-CoA acyltransferase